MKNDGVMMAPMGGEKYPSPVRIPRVVVPIPIRIGIITGAIWIGIVGIGVIGIVKRVTIVGIGIIGIGSIIS